MKIVYNRMIPFKGFSAINFWGIVFARQEFKELSKSTLNHEAIHTAQMKELLYIGFYLWYVIEWFIKLFVYGRKEAYRNISFEQEAYEHQHDYDYLKKRKHYAWCQMISQAHKAVI